LVVTVGKHPHQGNNNMNNGHTNGNQNRILWHSDGRSDDHDSQHGYYEYEDEFGFWHKRQRSYLAQLDNDGAFTVYSVWNVPLDQQQQQQQRQRQRQQQRQKQQRQQFGGRTNKTTSNGNTNRNRNRNRNSNINFNDMFHFHNHHAPQALVSRAVSKAQDLMHGRIDADKEYGHLYSSSTSLTYKRCVYSTSRPFGCYRLGRKATKVSLEVYWRVQRVLLKIYDLADAWLDLIYEEDDIFYGWKESIWKNTNAFGSKMAAINARWVRKLLERFRALLASVSASYASMASSRS